MSFASSKSLRVVLLSHFIFHVPFHYPINSDAKQERGKNTALVNTSFDKVALFELGKNNSDISRLSTEIIGDNSEKLADTILNEVSLLQCRV